jgi:formate/nitrite transporter FocA (FNT family)
MKISIAALFLLAARSCWGYSFVQPMRVAVRATTERSTSTLTMISDGTDRSERKSLDISKTTYSALVKSPKDAYIAFAEKGMSNAKMHWMKIFHQSVLGGCYVGFGGLLALSVAGNIAGIGFTNPGLVKMTFAALFPVNLLLIVMTGGQLFTGNSATVSAAKFEGMVYWRELWKSFGVSLLGNIVGCGLFALTADYVGLLKGGTGALASSTAIAKCSGTFGQSKFWTKQFFLLRHILSNSLVFIL